MCINIRILQIFLAPVLTIACLEAAGTDQRLIEAVKAQDTEALQRVIGQDVDVNASQADGATALHWAAYHDNVNAATSLIAAGAQVDATNDFGVTPLSLAATNGSPGMIETLLDAGANPNSPIATGDTPLMTAARTGRSDAVLVLLEAGADVNAREPDEDQTALMWALSEGHTDVAEILMANGADIHAITKGKFTSLMFAVRVDDRDASAMLLDAGVDINAAARDGHSALHVATMRGFSDLAMYLLDRGADPNVDGPGYAPLHWAVGTWETEMTGRNGIITRPKHEWSAMHGVQLRKYELVEHLLKNGADPDARLVRNPRRYGFTFASGRPKGSTPFALAALAGDATMMQLLVDFGADPLLNAERGMTPLMMAAGLRRNLAESIVPLSDSFEAVKLAVELGADVNAVDDRYGDTPLHGAARIKSAEIIQFLVDHGADVNVVNKRGQSPLYTAERYWPPGIAVIFQPSDAGDLLRELTLPSSVRDALDRWAEIPSEVRANIDTLLQRELETLSQEKDRRPEDPIYPPEGGFPES